MLLPGDTRPKTMNDETKGAVAVEQPQDAQQSPGLDLDDDTPLAPACDLSGEGSCEACQ